MRGVPRARRAISVLGFAIVAIVATWGVLHTSVGKQSKVSAEATAQAQDTKATAKQADAAAGRAADAATGAAGAAREAISAANATGAGGA